MANTPKHDRQQAIENATNLFWGSGFHATSMRSLKEATGMHPGSIYASFGSKDGLFREVLHHYATLGVDRLEHFKRISPSPLLALKDFVRDSVARSENAPSDMCLLVKTVTELTSENQDLLTEATELLGAMEARFVEVLSEAQNKGEVLESKDPAHLARYLQVQLIGLRGYARISANRNHIDVLLDDIFSKGLA